MSDAHSVDTEFRHSFLWRILAAAGGMVTSFLLTVVVVRGLDPRDAATFFAILAALSIGPLVGRLGLGANVVRLIPAESDPVARREIAGTHLLATALLSIITAPIIALIGCAAMIGQPGFVAVFVLATLLIAVESTRLMLSDIFAANGRIKASVATMHYVRSILALPVIAATVFTLGHESLDAVLATYFAVAAIQFAAALFHARGDIALPAFGPIFSTLRTALGHGVRLFSVDLSEFMIMQGSIWLATALMSPLHATQYALAITLGLQVTLFKNLAMTAVAPPAARLWAEGAKDKFVRLLSDAATLGAAVAVVLVAIIAIAGPYAIEVAYGASMKPTAFMLLIIAAGGAVQAGIGINSSCLILTGHLAEAARVAIGVVVVAVPCAIAAAYLLGPVALATVTAASLAVMSVGQFLNARRQLGTAPHANRHAVRAFSEILRGRTGEPAPADANH